MQNVPPGTHTMFSSGEAPGVVARSASSDMYSPVHHCSFRTQVRLTASPALTDRPSSRWSMSRPPRELEEANCFGAANVGNEPRRSMSLVLNASHSELL